MTNTQHQSSISTGPPSTIDAVRTRPVLGVPVTVTDYSEAVEVMDGMVESRETGYVCVAPVHALMVAQDDPEMMAALQGASMVVPDGMPLVWAANLLGEALHDRVYGPELMRRYSERCAERGHRVWLYGGRDQGSLVQLALSLRRSHPGIRIVGGYSPPSGRWARRRKRRWSSRSTTPGPTFSGSGSACRSRRSGWPACASGSTCR